MLCLPMAYRPSAATLMTKFASRLDTGQAPVMLSIVPSRRKPEIKVAHERTGCDSD